MSIATLQASKRDLEEGDRVMVRFPSLGGVPASIQEGVIVEIHPNASLCVRVKNKNRVVKPSQVQRIKEPEMQPPQSQSEPEPKSKPLTAKPFETLLQRMSEPPISPPSTPPIWEGPPLESALRELERHPPAPLVEPPPPPAATRPTDDIAAWLEMGRNLVGSTHERIATLRAEAVAKNEEADALEHALATMLRMQEVKPPQASAKELGDKPKPKLRTKRIDAKPAAPVSKPSSGPGSRGPNSLSLAVFVRRYPKMPIDELCELAQRSGHPNATVRQIRMYRWKDLNR